MLGQSEPRRVTQFTEQADFIAEKINLLGGQFPEVPQISVGERSSWRYLLDDLEEERRSSEEFFAQIRIIDRELSQVAELLQRIYEDETKHRNEQERC